MERRLDRDRPLWECWIVDGLACSRWALLMKIHHCIANGVAATHLLTGLCDDHGGQTFATAIRAAHAPAPGGLRLPALTLDPIDWVRLQTVHGRLTRTKVSGQREAGSIYAAENAIPYALTAWRFGH